MSENLGFQLRYPLPLGAKTEPHLNCCRTPDISTGEVLLLERMKSESASTKYDANITPP